MDSLGTTKSLGYFSYRVLPFRLCNALATSQRADLSIFAKLVHDVVEIYMDDFTPYGYDFQEALSNLGKVLHKYIEMNLSISPEKCEFLMTIGTALGHSISQQGLQVDPNKIAIIQRVPPPRKHRNVRSFLGLAPYYRRFIKDFSKLASPLFGLFAKDSEFIWSMSCQEALDILKDKLTTAPILRGPNWALPFHIHADATHKSIRVALGQIDEKFPYAIYFINFFSSVNLPIGEEAMVDDQLPNEHLFAITVLSPWFVDIENYLVSTHFPLNLSSKEKSKIVRKNTPFTWIGGNIFKLGPDQILRRCVRKEEVFDILLTCDDGPRGGHITAKRTKFKVLQAGYY
eukprot:PITA_25880